MASTTPGQQVDGTDADIGDALHPVAQCSSQNGTPWYFQSQGNWTPILKLTLWS
jgi:hypothetical protein